GRVDDWHLAGLVGLHSFWVGRSAVHRLSLFRYLSPCDQSAWEAAICKNSLARDAAQDFRLPPPYFSVDRFDVLIDVPAVDFVRGVFFQGGSGSIQSGQPRV